MTDKELEIYLKMLEEYKIRIIKKDGTTDEEKVKKLCQKKD